MEFYVRSAREVVILRAAEGIGTVEVLQALCLLTLCDIAGKSIISRLSRDQSVNPMSSRKTS